MTDHLGDRPLLLSFICVFNNRHVFADCLERSLQDLQSGGWAELVSIDNTAGEYRTAGAALNEGARRSAGRVLAFIHQDVYLHDLASLRVAAELMDSAPDVRLLGAVGFTPAGDVVGAVRDRVVMIGEAPCGPAVVDSVDELLFMERFVDWVREPISEEPIFAWHCYAVELGLRLTNSGGTVAVTELPLSHNSSASNTAGLAAARAALEDRYRQRLPLMTSTGQIVVVKPKWGVTWLASRVIRGVGRRIRARWAYMNCKVATRRWQTEVADLRLTFDAVVLANPGRAVRVFNASSNTRAAFPTIDLCRANTPVRFELVNHDDVFSCVVADKALAGHRASGESPMLHPAAALTAVTNLHSSHVRRLCKQAGEPRYLGWHLPTGYWLIWVR